jgi:hypothetical protein
MIMWKRNAGARWLATLGVALALGLFMPLGADAEEGPREQGLTADLSSVDVEQRMLDAAGRRFVVPEHMKQVDVSKLRPGQTVTLWWRGEGEGPFVLTGFELVEPH